MKRIRAVVSAVDRSCDQLFPAEMIQPFRLMFKAGGTIRDEQVQIGLVENFEKEHSVFSPDERILQARIRDQRDEFFVKSLDMEHSRCERHKGADHGFPPQAR